MGQRHGPSDHKLPRRCATLHYLDHPNSQIVRIAHSWPSSSIRRPQNLFAAPGESLASQNVESALASFMVRPLVLEDRRIDGAQFEGGPPRRPTTVMPIFDLARLNKTPIAIEVIERIDALFQRWSQLSEQFFRVGNWSLCRAWNVIHTSFLYSCEAFRLIAASSGEPKCK
jgi:hypothetical protein